MTLYKIENASDDLKDLYRMALLARGNSYSPYSECKVGSAVRVATGSETAIYSGCNVENSSYGATNCAERVAIQKAASEKGRIVLKDVLVITDSKTPWPPCGICRQVMAEFAPKMESEVRIYLANVEGSYTKHTLRELLPLAFTEEFL